MAYFLSRRCQNQSSMQYFIIHQESLRQWAESNH